MKIGIIAGLILCGLVMSCSSYDRVITNRALSDAIGSFEQEYMDSLGDERPANILILNFALEECGTYVSITASNALLDTLVYEINEFNVDVSSFDELVVDQQCTVEDMTIPSGCLPVTSLNYVGAYMREHFLVAIYADKGVDVDKYIDRRRLLDKEFGWIHDHYCSPSYRFRNKHVSLRL